MNQSFEKPSSPFVISNKVECSALPLGSSKKSREISPCASLSRDDKEEVEMTMGWPQPIGWGFSFILHLEPTGRNTRSGDCELNSDSDRYYRKILGRHYYY